MTAAPGENILLVLDDREFAAGPVRGVVGERRFGDIVFRRSTLADRFRAALPAWAAHRLHHLRSGDDVARLRNALEHSTQDAAAFICAARAGFPEPDRLHQLAQRVPYADHDFTDRLYNPLIVFLRNAHRLIDRWPQFETSPVHLWEEPWADSLRLESLVPMDLGQVRELVAMTSGSTDTRHFNEAAMDTYFFTKSSTDKQKMLAEYSFYDLVPESMRPWLIQPFDYRDHGDRASYRMMRYYLPDAALQWVHGAFDAASFAAFTERLLFFVAQRPSRACSASDGAGLARALFVEKPVARLEQLLGMPAGRRIDQLLASTSPGLALGPQMQRYQRLYERHEKAFATNQLCVGHGDPCFSNVLYEQQHHLLKLIDPRGATTEAGLWTHPLYDLCKISHSVLGDYDFINHGLYSVCLSDGNEMRLRVAEGDRAHLKRFFRSRLQQLGYDPRIVRLGEASLFLSMLPLHIDHPNKVVAFALTAAAILDEVEDA